MQQDTQVQPNNAPTLVSLAKLLGDIGVLQIVQQLDNGDVLVKINNQEYRVSDSAERRGDWFVVNKYNTYFYRSTTGTDCPRIDAHQNQEILFEVARSLLRFLPAYCAPDDNLTNEEITAGLKNVRAQVFSLLPDAKEPNMPLLKEVGDYLPYDEFYQCENTLISDAGDIDSLQTTFWYLHRTDKRGNDAEDSGTDNEDEVEAIRCDSTKDTVVLWDKDRKEEMKALIQMLNANKNNQTTDTLKRRFQRIASAHLREALDILANDLHYLFNIGKDNIETIRPESMKYWRVVKQTVSITGAIPSPSFSEQEPDSYFRYEPRVLLAKDAAEHNIYRCMSPSCTRYAYMANKSASFGFQFDYNWVKEADGKLWHPMGCQCMSDRCRVCGQHYFPYNDKQIDELRNFLGYHMREDKAFLGEQEKTKTPMDPQVRLLMQRAENPLTVADFCLCQNNLFWYYDEMYEKPQNRIALKNDVVFVNTRTKEVVGAYSPWSYRQRFGLMEQLYDEGFDQKQLSHRRQLTKDNMIAKQNTIYFTEYLRVKTERHKKNGSEEYARFVALMQHIMKQAKVNEKEETKDMHYLDYLNATLFGNVCKAVDAMIRYNKTIEEVWVNDKQRVALEYEKVDGTAVRLAIIAQIDKVMTEFKHALSALLAMDGDKQIVKLTTINSCALCSCCGSLYYNPDSNTGLQVLDGGDNDDGCEGGRTTGRWATSYGSVFYRAGGAAHINHRTVLDKRGGEMEYGKWQQRMVHDKLMH